MQNRFKSLLLILGFFFCLGILAVFFLSYQLQENRVQNQLQNLALKELNRNLQIEKIEAGLGGLFSGIRFKNIRLMDPLNNSADLSIESLSLTPSWGDIITGTLSLSEFNIKGIRLYIQFRADLEHNFQDIFLYRKTLGISQVGALPRDGQKISQPLEFTGNPPNHPVHLALKNGKIEDLSIKIKPPFGLVPTFFLGIPHLTLAIKDNLLTFEGQIRAPILFEGDPQLKGSLSLFNPSGHQLTFAGTPGLKSLLTPFLKTKFPGATLTEKAPPFSFQLEIRDSQPLLTFKLPDPYQLEIRDLYPGQKGDISLMVGPINLEKNRGILEGQLGVFGEALNLKLKTDNLTQFDQIKSLTLNGKITAENVIKNLPQLAEISGTKGVLKGDLELNGDLNSDSGTLKGKILLNPNFTIEIPSFHFQTGGTLSARFPENALYGDGLFCTLNQSEKVEFETLRLGLKDHLLDLKIKPSRINLEIFKPLYSEAGRFKKAILTLSGQAKGIPHQSDFSFQFAGGVQGGEFHAKSAPFAPLKFNTSFEITPEKGSLTSSWSLLGQTGSLATLIDNPLKEFKINGKMEFPIRLKSIPFATLGEHLFQKGSHPADVFKKIRGEGEIPLKGSFSLNQGGAPQFDFNNSWENLSLTLGNSEKGTIHFGKGNFEVKGNALLFNQIGQFGGKPFSFQGGADTLDKSWKGEGIFPLPLKNIISLINGLSLPSLKLLENSKVFGEGSLKFNGKGSPNSKEPLSHLNWELDLSDAQFTPPNLPFGIEKLNLNGEGDLKNIGLKGDFFLAGTTQNFTLKSGLSGMDRNLGFQCDLGGSIQKVLQLLKGVPGFSEKFPQLKEISVSGDFKSKAKISLAKITPFDLKNLKLEEKGILSVKNFSMSHQPTGFKFESGTLNSELAQDLSRFSTLLNGTAFNSPQRVDLTLTDLLHKTQVKWVSQTKLDLKTLWDFAKKHPFFDHPDYRDHRQNQITGLLSCQIEMDESLENLKSLDLQKMKLKKPGMISLEKGTLLLPQHKVAIQDFNGQFHLAPDLSKIEIKELIGRMSRSFFKGGGEILLKPQPTLNITFNATAYGEELTPILNHKSDTLNKLDGVYSLQGTIKGPPDPLRIKVEAGPLGTGSFLCPQGGLILKVPQENSFRMVEIPFQNLKGRLLYEEKRLHFEDFVFKVFGGSGSISKSYISFKEDVNSIFFKLNGTASDIDLSDSGFRLMSLANSKSSPIWGRANGTFTLGGNHVAPETLNGEGFLEVNQMKIDVTNIMEKGLQRDIIKTLNLGSKTWKDYKAAFKVVKGWVEPNNLDLSCDGLDLKGSGRMHLTTLMGESDMNGFIFGGLLDSIKFLIDTSQINPEGKLPFTLKVKGPVTSYGSYHTDLFSKGKTSGIVGNTQKAIGNFLNKKLGDIFK